MSSHASRAAVAAASLAIGLITAFPTVTDARGTSAPLTADDVIKHFIAARGGRARLDSVHSARLFGSLTLTPGGSGPMLVLIARPVRIRTQFTLDGKTMVQGYDGRIAWLSDGSTAHELEPEQSKNVAAGADLDGPLVDHAAKGSTVTLAGLDSADGRPAYKLNVKLASGLEDSYWIDAKSWLQTKWQGAREQGGEIVIFQSLFRDYRPVHGVLFAFRIETSTLHHPGGQVIAIDSVRVNVPFGAADFTMPTLAPAKDD